jgi:hypothetical protein
MADEKRQNFPDSDTTASNEDKRRSGTYDPELEMPDPEQVERDRQEQEKIYGEDEPRNPAA